MASLEDYLSGATVSGRKASEYDKLVKSLQSYGSSAKTAAALGVDTNTNAAPGILDFLLSPERGVLTAPGRLIRTTISGPEAAAGFGNVGALKVEEGDNLLTQAGKLVGAFTLDVATDPLSYIGAPTSIGRAGISKVASNLGDDAIKSLSKAANIDENVLVEKLAERSRVGQAAALQDKVGMDVGDAEGLAKNLISGKEGKRKYAVMEMGSILGDALYSRGRRGVVADLASVASLAGVDEQTAIRAARQAFSELPSEVQGGARILNPITGRSWARMSPAGSAGVLDATGLGGIADVANRARLFTSRTAGMAATKYLSGTSGPILQGVKRAAKGQAALPDPSLGRVTILDWANFGKEVKKRDDVLGKLQAAYLAPIWIAGKAGANLGEENVESYNDLLFQNLTRRQATPAPGTPDFVVTEAQVQAANVRKALNDLRDELNDAGFDVSDLSDNFFPLMFTEEAAERYKMLSRAGRVSTGYTGAGGRKFGFKVISDPDAGDEFGFAVEGFEDVYAANPKTAGKIVAERLEKQGFKGVTEDSFVTDPVAALTRYADVMTQRLSTKRFVDSVVESGLGVRDVSRTISRLNERAMSTLAETLTGLAPAARATAEQVQDNAREELATIAADGKALASRLREARDEAEVNYRAAKEAEAAAAKVAKAARADVIKAKVKPREVVETLRRYARSGATIVDTEAAAGSAANAAARAQRATARADEAEAALNDLETLAKSLDDRYTAAAAKTTDEQMANALDELLSAEEAQLFATSARQFARTMSAARAEVEGRFAGDMVSRITELESAVIRQAEAAEAYAAATVTRRRLKEQYDKLNNARKLEQSAAIDAVIDTYLNARSARIAAQNAGATPDEVAALLAAEGTAEDTMRRVLSQNKRFKGEVAEYAERLEQVVDKLNRVEFTAASVFASEDKLRNVVEMISNNYNTPEQMDAMFTDLVESYKAIRGKVSKEELELLSPEQRKVFEAGTDSLKKESAARSEFGNLLSENLGNPNASLHPLGGAFEDVYAPLEIKESLEQLLDMSNRKTEWQKKIEDYVDPVLLLWRLQVTQLRGPAYTLLNLSGGMVNNMIGGVTLKNTQSAFTTATKLYRLERRIRKEFSNLPELELVSKVRKALLDELGTEEYYKLEAFLQRGGANTTATIEQIRQASRLGTAASDLALSRRGSRAISPNTPPTTRAGEIGSGVVNWILTNPFTSALSDINQSTEVFLRYAAFRQGMDKFKNYDAAMDLSMALHFNYEDLSNAEKWVRRFVPFYVWTRNNIPLQVRTMFLQPGKLTKFLYARQELENTFGDDEEWMKLLLPEYAQISGGFAVDIGDNKLFFVDRLPYQDLNRMFQVGGFPIRTRELASSVGPIGGLYGILSGVDTGTGRAYDPAGTPAPLWARPLAPLLPRSAEGEPLIPEQVAALVNEIIPTAGVLERAASTLLPEGIAPSSQTDRRLSNLLNTLGVSGALGQSTGTLTPATARGALRARQTTLTNRIAAAAEQMNVDLDWVREQLRGGASPEMVLNMINAGMGRRQAGLEEGTSLDFEKRQALNEILGGM